MKELLYAALYVILFFIAGLFIVKMWVTSPTAAYVFASVWIILVITTAVNLFKPVK